MRAQESARNGPKTDLRLPENRRETFLRFFEYHVKYRAHPGAVYYLMPWLRRRYQWTEHEAIWFAFLNGNTQHPPTSLLLFNAWASAPKKAQAVPTMLEFFKENYDRLAFDTDRRYHKIAFPEAVASYQELTRDAGGWAFWRYHAGQGGWKAIWGQARKIETFGRLSAFSYAEYLRIMGVPFDCEDLLLGDRSGSRSHRNGLCIVTGREHLDWHQSNPTFNGKYPKPLIAQLTQEAAQLLAEAQLRPVERYRWRDSPLGGAHGDVGYFTLESALCTYKSWHRPNRRYPNVYNDMLYERLKQTEERWGAAATEPFWQARQECLPAHMRLEDNAGDPGVHPIKQNWYRETGTLPMMGHDYPDMWSDFDDGVREQRWGKFR